MLYEDIRLGCKKYHDSDYAYDDAYTNYMFRDKDKSKWDDPELLDLVEVKRLILFVNQWRTRMRRCPHNLLQAMKNTLPDLNLLKGKTILDIDFREPTSTFSSNEDMIQYIFNAIAQHGPQYESVGASKMLHTINPELFVMWDSAIRDGYGLGVNGRMYAHYFLPKMQQLAQQAVDEVMETEYLSLSDAIKSLAPHPNSHTLAKVLDEYNYSRFTA